MVNAHKLTRFARSVVKRVATNKKQPSTRFFSHSPRSGQAYTLINRIVTNLKISVAADTGLKRQENGVMVPFKLEFWVIFQRTKKPTPIVDNAELDATTSRVILARHPNLGLSVTASFCVSQRILKQLT